MNNIKKLLKYQSMRELLKHFELKTMLVKPYNTRLKKGEYNRYEVDILPKDKRYLRTKYHKHDDNLTFFRCYYLITLEDMAPVNNVIKERVVSHCTSHDSISMEEILDDFLKNDKDKLLAFSKETGIYDYQLFVHYMTKRLVAPYKNFEASIVKMTNEELTEYFFKGGK